MNKEKEFGAKKKDGGICGGKWKKTKQSDKRFVLPLVYSTIMITPIEILGIAAVVFSNIVAYFSLKRLKDNEKRRDRNRNNQQNSFS